MTSSRVNPVATRRPSREFHRPELRLRADRVRVGLEALMIRPPSRCSCFWPRLPRRDDSRTTSRRPARCAPLLATNPVQAFVDPATNEVRGPAAEHHARARRAPACRSPSRARTSVAGRDRRREERAGRHRLFGVRSGARRAGRFLAGLFAGAEHLSGGGGLADQVSCRRRPRGHPHWRRRARRRRYFLTRTLKQPSSSATKAASPKVALQALPPARSTPMRATACACMRRRRRHWPASRGGQFLRRRAGRDRAERRRAAVRDGGSFIEDARASGLTADRSRASGSSASTSRHPKPRTQYPK